MLKKKWYFFKNKHIKIPLAHMSTYYIVSKLKINMHAIKYWVYVKIYNLLLI